MRFVSLFAGIGGFDLGLEAAGHTCVGQCEIDPHARAVLQRHWPDVPKHDDVTTLQHDTFAHPDIVTFGSPCQDLSQAGKRSGLGGARSGLFTEAVRYIRDIQEASDGQYPKYAVWENVPGAYSSNGGRDFAAVLELLVGGTVPTPAAGSWPRAGVAFGPQGSVEWRTLDSQHFGVPQRRHRIFLVYRPGSDRAGEVLFEPASGAGPADARGASGEAVAGTLGTSSTFYRGDGADPIVVAPLPVSFKIRGGKAGGGKGYLGSEDRAFTLSTVQEQNLFVSGDGVRRYTPLETERLQGFPDNHTRYRPDGTDISDTQRYRMTGNAVSVPVAVWLGARLNLTQERSPDG
jgi:DNA (cytosine-5)-methyltransferase 1